MPLNCKQPGLAPARLGSCRKVFGGVIGFQHLLRTSTWKSHPSKPFHPPILIIFSLPGRPNCKAGDGHRVGSLSNTSISTARTLDVFSQSRPGAAAARAALLDFTTRLGKLETQRSRKTHLFGKIRKKGLSGGGTWGMPMIATIPMLESLDVLQCYTLISSMPKRSCVQVFQVQALSGLSPWLHFGGLSRWYGLLGESLTCDGLVRSELFMNYCIYWGMKYDMIWYDLIW